MPKEIVKVNNFCPKNEELKSDHYRESEENLRKMKEEIELQK
jgi:hypothetical protein